MAVIKRTNLSVGLLRGFAERPAHVSCAGIGCPFKENCGTYQDQTGAQLPLYNTWVLQGVCPYLTWVPVAMSMLPLPQELAT